MQNSIGQISKIISIREMCYPVCVVDDFYTDSTTLNDKKKLLKDNVRSEMNGDLVNCFIPHSEEMNELFIHQTAMLSVQ